MQFKNLVKAQITQGLMKTLFEQQGYRVTRLGVEELISEIIHLDDQQYRQLALPEALRFLPDFLVAEPNLTRAFLVEVKFREKFDEQTLEELYSSLSTQRQYWPQSYAIILLGTPFPNEGKFHQDRIGVLKPDDTELLHVNNIDDTSVSLGTKLYQFMAMAVWEFGMA